MALIQARCSNCGGELSVDDSRESALCPYCNTPYIISKDIYNITNNVVVGKGGIVNIVGSQQSDFVIEADKLVAYKGSSANVIIPEGVREIRDDVFSGMKMNSVVIPGSVKIIGSFLQGGMVEKITLAYGVEMILANAFSCNGLKKIFIPPTVSVIGDGAFSGCRFLNGVELPTGITRIGKRTFENCSSLSEIKLPEQLKLIDESAFENCESMSSITIPSSVTEIGMYAFRNCSSLKNVVFADRKKVQDHYTAFEKCPYSLFAPTNYDFSVTIVQ